MKTSQKIEKKGKKSDKNYTHLSYNERLHLGYLYNRENRGTLREIGAEMNRSHNTIALEIKSGLVDGIYEPDVGQFKADALRNKSKTGLLKILQDGVLRTMVEKMIRKKISPRRISGILKRRGVIISAKAIYKFVYAYNLESFLPFKGKKREKKGQYVYRKAKELDKKRIKDRPDIKDVYGHYEMDFIVSSQSSYSLFVLTEILTKKFFVEKIENRSYDIVRSTLKKMIGDKKIVGITTDNDIAFGCWREIEKDLDTQVWFCEPYHSWEKPLIENSNSWVRLFIPKKSDIKFVTEEKLQEIREWFNDYGREVIGFKSANELELEHSCTN
jgi:transposase, IS30 family